MPSALGLINLGVKIILLDGGGRQTNRYQSIIVVGKEGTIILSQ